MELRTEPHRDGCGRNERTQVKASTENWHEGSPQNLDPCLSQMGIEKAVRGAGGRRGSGWKSLYRDLRSWSGEHGASGCCIGALGLFYSLSPTRTSSAATPGLLSSHYNCGPPAPTSPSKVGCRVNTQHLTGKPTRPPNALVSLDPWGGICLHQRLLLKQAA